MIEYAAIAGVSCLYIAAKAFQQLNVIWKKYAWVPLLTYIMAFCEVFLWGNAAASFVNENFLHSVFVALALGTGGWIGCYGSMFSHKKLTGGGYGKK